VSKWEYDEKTIRKREKKCVPGKKSCKDEKWFKRNILNQLEKKFHQTRSFEFAFIHSYSQTEDNKDDESEQKHWKEETDKLWTFVTSNNSSFELKGVDDILADNRRLKRQVEEYENTIDTDIANLKEEIQMIKETNDAELNQLKDDNLVNKEELTLTINTNKEELTQTINTNKQELTTKMQNIKLQEVPLGTILAWVNKPVTDTDKFVDLPDGWHYCDGSTIPHGSIWAGKKIPDLNNESRFLRGGIEKQMLTLEDDQFQLHYHKHSHSITDTGHQHTYYDRYAADTNAGKNYWGWTQGSDNVKYPHTDLTYRSTTGIKIQSASGEPSGKSGSETRPKNMRVLYIMRVW